MGGNIYIPHQRGIRKIEQIKATIPVKLFEISGSEDANRRIKIYSVIYTTRWYIREKHENR